MRFVKAWAVVTAVFLACELRCARVSCSPVKRLPHPQGDADLRGGKADAGRRPHRLYHEVHKPMQLVRVEHGSGHRARHLLVPDDCAQDGRLNGHTVSAGRGCYRLVA